MSKKKKISIVTICTILIIAIIIAFIVKWNEKNDMQVSSEEITTTNVDSNFNSDDLDETYNNISATITLADNNTKVDGNGATVNENTITINQAGTYYISGSLSDGNIIINASKNDNVKLVLANANIACSSTSAIYCMQAGKIIITLKEDTTNCLSDASTYNYESTSEDEPDATIFSKSDLTINGTGTLEIKANYKDAIASKDGLKIINSNININSEDDSIRGKDYIRIKNANIKIKSNGDGIKSTNDEDSSLGYITIEDSNINIQAENDGIQAVSVIDIKSGTIEIETGGGSSNSKKTTSTDNFYDKNTSSQTATDDTSSAKGIKAGKEITIESGTININSSDDAVHSNENVIILEGNITIQTGDDGIHADSNIKIDDGKIDIQKCYEGIESMYIEINNGEISVISSDDGINVAGGSDSSSVNGRPGQNSFDTSNSNEKLVINGGNITVNATGDGLDSNGSMYINGGTITVYGPTANDNAALDYNGECVITAGTLTAVGSSGMMQAPSSSSTQCSFTTTISGNAGDSIVIKTSSGEEIASFTTKKAYQMLTFSSSQLKTGESYQIYVNGTQKTTISQTSTTTQIGSATMGGGMQGRF